VSPASLPPNVKPVRIFVSSPGDVAAERAKVEEILGWLQVEFSGQLELDPYFWENEPMGAHTDFQTQIEPPSRFDIFICLLFSRLGTEPHPGLHRKAGGGKYASGTEYELLDALNGFRLRGAPEVYIYKREGTPVIPAEPKEERERIAAQYDALKDFYDKFTKQDDHYVVASKGYTGLEEFETRFQTDMRKILKRHVPQGGAGSRAAPKTWLSGSPFRGLHHFDFEHAAIFCGRTRAIDEVLTALKQQAADGCAFVLVFGGSGVGKSSLVRGGVLPFLVKPGIIDGVRLWRRAVMRPSDAAEGDLFDALATALVRGQALPELAQHEIDGPQLARMLREAPEAAGVLIQRELSQISQDVRRIHKLDKPPRALFVLAIDQLEELFTIERLTPVREVFLRSLDTLARSGCVWVVATLRSDFYQRCAESPILGELVKKGAGQYCLLPPDETQLRQMIQLPAFAAGLHLERDHNTGEHLDDLLRAAAVKNPSTLPLLEFALQQLYKQRDLETGQLKLAAYHGFGGVEGALGKHAEESFQEMSKEARASFGDVFLQLVTIGQEEGEPAVRQWARKADVETSDGRRELVAQLIAARLLFADCTELGVDVVTIAHEAMLASWPRLHKWVADHRESLKFRAQIAAEARTWRENDQNPDFLYKGLALEKAHRAMESKFLRKDEEKFVEASLAHAAEQTFQSSLASGQRMQEASADLRAKYPEVHIRVLKESLQTDSNETARRNAVILLGPEQEPALAEDMVQVALSDPEESVRRAAALTLAQWDDLELYARLEGHLKQPGTHAPAVRALAGIRVAADRWIRAPAFDRCFAQLSGSTQQQIRRKAWGLRFSDGTPVLPFIFIPAAMFAAITAGVIKTIPGAFDWGLVQAQTSAPMGFFHGLIGGVMWAGAISLGLSLYRLVFGRDLIRGSYWKPPGALGVGALIGLISSILVVLCIASVYSDPALITMGWIQKPTQNGREPLLTDLFYNTGFGWCHLITGVGIGIGMALMTNGLQASPKWKEFLHSQARLTSLKQARELIWGLMKVALPYSWPLPLVIGLAAIAASFAPRVDPPEDPGKPTKAHRLQIVQGLTADCGIQIIGAYFAVVGMGFGIVILRYGLNVDARRT
jgi:hypothetical protein